MFKETVPAIIVSDFDSETENVIYNPSKYQEPKPNKLKIVLPPVYEETNDVEFEEQKTFSDGEAEIRKIKNKIINKFNLNPVKKLTKSHSEDSGFLLNREKSKTRFLPKTKKTTKKLKRTKRAQSSDDNIDHDAFKEMVLNNEKVGGFGSRRLFNKNEIVESSGKEPVSDDDILKDVPDYERSNRKKAQMQTFLKDFNTLVISEKSTSKSKLTTGKYLHFNDFQFCLSHTNFKEAEILNWFKGFRKECPGGHLTRSHLASLFRKAFSEDNGDVFANHIFRIFDKDGNGFLDFKEFLMAINVTTCNTLTEKMTWAFRLYDVDNNGVIDVNEMTEILEILDDVQNPIGDGDDAPKSSKETAEIFLELLDLDGSGGITLDEFLKTGKKLFSEDSAED